MISEGEKSHLVTQRTITVPMAMDCAASSIHHSPLSHMLPLLGRDTESHPVAQPHTGISRHTARAQLIRKAMAMHIMLYCYETAWKNKSQA